MGLTPLPIGFGILRLGKAVICSLENHSNVNPRILVSNSEHFCSIKAGEAPFTFNKNSIGETKVGNIIGRLNVIEMGIFWFKLQDEVCFGSKGIYVLFKT